LFVGPRGTGKTTIARIFAKCLNCTGGPKAVFPDDDPRVMEITEGRSLDVLEIDGASNRGIDEIRQLRDTVNYAPASGKFKIYIIDEVHMLTKEAFNALLKTLEEPPEHVKFMFATTEPDKVLPTILSRCQRFDLRRIPSALIVKHLAQIAATEGVEIDEAALHAVARGADGGMRDAESTLDQLISFCGQRIAEQDVLSMFGLAAQSQIFALTDAVLTGMSEEALRQLNILARQGKDLGRIITELLNHFRNLLIFQVASGDLGLIEASEAVAAVLGRQAPLVSTEALTRLLEILTDCEGRLRDAVSKKILVEVALLKLIEARHSVSIDAVLKQLHKMRQEAGTPSTTAVAPQSTPHPRPAPAPVEKRPEPAPALATAALPAPVHAAVAPAPALPPALAPVATVPVTAPAPTPVPSHTPVAPPAPVIHLDQLWNELLESAGRASPFIKQYLIEAHPVSMTTKLLTVGFDPEFADHISLIDNSKNQQLLQTKLAELGFRNMNIKFIKAETPSGYKRAVPLPPEPETPSQTPVAPPTPPVPPPVASKPSPAPIVADSVTAAAPTPAVQQPAAPAPVDTPAPAPVHKSESIPFSKDDFKNDPLIQKALEMFKAQVIDVRA
jgi:DNA polymerase-3 subunit gamma/tau